MLGKSQSYPKGTRVIVNKTAHHAWANQHGWVTGGNGVYFGILLDSGEKIALHYDQFKAAGQGDTPIEAHIKLMSKRATVVLVDGIDTHFINVRRKDIIELINNPHTYRVTVQHKNGNIKGIFGRGELHKAIELVSGKKDYTWVICGGAIE